MLIAIAALALISGQEAEGPYPQWIEVRPERGLAYAIQVSEIDPIADVRTAVIVYTHDRAPNPAGQYFSVMRGEVDCRRTTAWMSEVATYKRSGSSLVLPLEREPKPVTEGSVDALVCSWPAWARPGHVIYDTASQFADAVAARNANPD